MIRSFTFLGSLAIIAMLTLGADASSHSNLVESHEPVAYWRLGETSGTTAVDKSGAQNGTYKNSVTLGSTTSREALDERSLRLPNP